MSNCTRKVFKKYCLLTNDVESHSIWYNCLRDETGLQVLKEGMPLLLDIYAKHNIQSTFFFTGYIAQKFPQVVKMILPFGHEVGCHGLSHRVEDAFDVLSYEEQVKHLCTSKKILEDISGQEVISFRAPALRVNQYTPLALAETGFKIDSSVASQRFDMFLSFGSLKKLKWLIAPRLPYRTREDDLFKSGNGTIVEVPLSAVLFPYVGTTMRIFPTFTRIARQILHWENKLNRKPIVFDIHPNEFLNEHNGLLDEREIIRRNSNFISFILRDLIRAKLKVKNLGKKAIPIYTREIEFFKSKNYHFTTLKNYVSEIGFDQ